MDLHGGLPYWLLRGGLRTVVGPLERDQECDVVVVGSGVSGALVAHRLAAAGKRVIVLDRRDVAQGSTMASTALLLYELDVPLYRLESMLGTRRARRAYTIGVEAIAGLRSMAAKVGVRIEAMPSIHIALRGSRIESLRQEFAARRRAGLAVRWLDAGELRGRWGVRALGGIESRPAAQVDPFRFTHAVLALAAGRGAKVYDRTCATSIDTDRQGVWVSTDRGARLRAAHVVQASGYEAAQRLPRGLIRLRSTYAFASEPTRVPHGRKCMVWEHADPYLYVRWHGSRLLVGGEDRAFTNEARRDRLIAEKAVALAEKTSKLLPDVTFEPAFAWCGTFGTTPDGLGYIGCLPGRTREHFALGFGGNGMTLAVTAAAMIAGRILGTTEGGQDRGLFAFGRSRS